MPRVLHDMIIMCRIIVARAHSAASRDVRFSTGDYRHPYFSHRLRSNNSVLFLSKPLIISCAALAGTARHRLLQPVTRAQRLLQPVARLGPRAGDQIVRRIELLALRICSCFNFLLLLFFSSLRLRAYHPSPSRCALFDKPRAVSAMKLRQLGACRPPRSSLKRANTWKSSCRWANHGQTCALLMLQR